MDRLGQLRVFVQVATMGSFIAAARTLELPRATVSAAVQALEQDLGARLLQRTTRQVQLTADGMALVERARALLADAESLDQLFRTRRQQVVGRLRVDVPSRIARRLVAPALPALLRRHPQLQLVLGSSDRAVELVKEQVDCAIRVGTPAESSLVARPLGRVAMVNCASPGYLRAHGLPRRPEELTEGGHLAIGYASPVDGHALPWEFVAEGREQALRVPSRVVVNNVESYIACCRAGLGLIQVPRYDVRDLFDAGQLVEVMPERRPPSMPVAALYAHRRDRNPRLAAFLAWFEGLMRPHLEPESAGPAAA